MNVSREIDSNLNILPQMAYVVCLNMVLLCYRIIYLQDTIIKDLIQNTSSQKGVLFVLDTLVKLSVSTKNLKYFMQ